MESGKHKKKIHYTIMIISDSPEEGKTPLHIRRGLAIAAFSLIFITLAGAVGAALYYSMGLWDAEEKEAELQMQIDRLTQENQELTADNSELSDKVAILSDSVARSEETKAAQEAQEEAKRIPNGFPIAGPAVILESSETAAAAPEENAEGDGEGGAQEEGQAAAQKEPIVVFSAAAGTKIVAAASGVVSSVEDDAEYGYRLRIDHGNGYESIYRSASEPDVREGDEVESGDVLYEMESDEEKLGYQIAQDGVLIDPLDLLEVYG